MGSANSNYCPSHTSRRLMIMQTIRIYPVTDQHWMLYVSSGCKQITIGCPMSHLDENRSTLDVVFPIWIKMDESWMLYASSGCKQIKIGFSMPLLQTCEYKDGTLAVNGVTALPMMQSPQNKQPSVDGSLTKWAMLVAKRSVSALSARDANKTPKQQR